MAVQGRWRRVVEPVEEPVTLEEARGQCRIDGTAEDELLAGAVGAARQHLEEITGRALLTQTWELFLDAWPGGREIALPRPPLQSVTSVKYVDVDDVEHTLAGAAYLVDTVGLPGRLVLREGASWPAAALRAVNGVCVRFVAGWPEPGDAPAELRLAARMLVGHWFENREAVSSQPLSETPWAVDAVVFPWKVW